MTFPLRDTTTCSRSRTRPSSFMSIQSSNNLSDLLILASNSCYVWENCRFAHVMKASWHGLSWPSLSPVRVKTHDHHDHHCQQMGIVVPALHTPSPPCLRLKSKIFTLSQVILSALRIPALRRVMTTFAQGFWFCVKIKIPFMTDSCNSCQSLFFPSSKIFKGQ